jgi:hypothetical protein
MECTRIVGYLTTLLIDEQLPSNRSKRSDEVEVTKNFGDVREFYPRKLPMFMLGASRLSKKGVYTPFQL